jgi:hypothetical protein
VLKRRSDDVRNYSGIPRFVAGIAKAPFQEARARFLDHRANQRVRHNLATLRSRFLVVAERIDITNSDGVAAIAPKNGGYTGTNGCEENRIVRCDVLLAIIGME